MLEAIKGVIEGFGRMNIWGKLLSVIGFISACLGLVDLAWGKKAIVRTFFKWVYQKTVFQLKLPARIGKIEEGVQHLQKMLGDVHYQTHPNGNGSMSDRSARIEERQKIVEANQQKQMAMLDKLIEMMEEHKRTITTLQNRLRVRDMVAEAMIMHIMPDGRCEFVNPFMLTLLGYTENDIMGISWEGLIHPQDLPGLQKTLARAAQTADSFRHEVRVRDFHGNWYDGKFMAQAVKADNKLEKFYVVIHFIPDTDKR